MERHSSDGSETAAGGHGTQFLTLRLGDADYALEILSVQEIRGHGPVTPIPNSPCFTKGVMNLRGTIIPVLDLGLRLGAGAVDAGTLAVTVVVRVGSKVAGLIVDAVSDVLTFDPDEVQPAPDLSGGTATPFVKGVVRQDSQLFLILDVERILAEDPATTGMAA